MKTVIILVLLVSSLFANAKSNVFFNAHDDEGSELIFATMEILSGTEKQGEIIESGEAITLENGVYTVLVSHLAEQEHWTTNSYGRYTYEWEAKECTLNVNGDINLDIEILKVYHFVIGACDAYYNIQDNVIVKCEFRNRQGDSYNYIDTIKEGQETIIIPALEGYEGQFKCYKETQQGSYTIGEFGDQEPMLVYVKMSYPTYASNFESESLKFPYPNPATDFITIPYSVQDKTTLRIFDVNGRLTLSRELDQYSNEILLNLSTFNTGMYICKYNNVAKRFTIIDK